MKKDAEVKSSCIDSDAHLKALAVEYKKTSKSLSRRIKKIKREIELLERQSPVKIDLEERLNILNQMYRTTTEIGREAEHYYEKGWCRSAIYTLNARK